MGNVWGGGMDSLSSSSSRTWDAGVVGVFGYVRLDIAFEIWDRGVCARLLAAKLQYGGTSTGTEEGQVGKNRRLILALALGVDA